MPDITLTAEQSVFIRSFPKKIYGKGETIIYQGDEIKNVFFLSKGDCSRKIYTDSGEEIVYDRRTANNSSNDFVAAIYSYIIEKKSSFTYYTDNGCEVNIIPQKDFMDFLSDNPKLMHGLLFRICNRYNDLNQNFLSKRSNNTTALICAILSKSAIEKNGEFLVDKKLTVTEISRRVGSHRVTVSKIINRLIQEEVVEKTSRGIRILDKDTLDEYAKDVENVDFKH